MPRTRFLLSMDGKFNRCQKNKGKSTKPYKKRQPKTPEP